MADSTGRRHERDELRAAAAQGLEPGRRGAEVGALTFELERALGRADPEREDTHLAVERKHECAQCDHGEPEDDDGPEKSILPCHLGGAERRHAGREPGKPGERRRPSEQETGRALRGAEASAAHAFDSRGANASDGGDEDERERERRKGHRQRGHANEEKNADNGLRDHQRDSGRAGKTRRHSVAVHDLRQVYARPRLGRRGSEQNKPDP